MLKINVNQEYINSDKYIGENKNKVKEGYGIYYYSDGFNYEGEFKNDLKDGYGIYYCSNGFKYGSVLFKPINFLVFVKSIL